MTTKSSSDKKGSIIAHDIGIRFHLAFQKKITLKEATITIAKRQSLGRTLWALRNISFQLQKGEVVGIIGRNGSGKSTLLRLLAGVYRPDEGSISVAGRIGALIDLSAGLHPDLTGEENIYLNGAIIGMSRKEVRNKFDSIVEFSVLEDFIFQPVKFYSSGMKLRLGFATAVHMKPDILLVDEVLAVGDADFKFKCYKKFDELLKKKVTTLIVSHDMNLITDYCQNVIWLDKGHIRDIGTATKIQKNYREFVTNSQ
jgi:ABC-type polysaccharide/polyol phosphate transport system ATPase subunit